MRKLLYYPYISIPNESWLIQSLLYWDGVATIVPLDIMQRPAYFTSFSRKLVQDGIIETVQPDEYAYSYPDYYLSFLDWVEKNSSHFSLNQSEKNTYCSPLNNIHAGKLGYIGTELERMGLAKRMDNQWYAMDSQLSKSFMTFLAMLIGQKTGMIPTTNTYHGMSSIFCIDDITLAHNANAIKSTLRTTLLNEFLPVPSKVNDLNDLLQFKDRYHDELIRFRTHVEKFISAQESAPIEMRDVRHMDFIDKSRDEIEQLTGHMRCFHAPRIDMGTLVAAIPSAFEMINGNQLGAAASLIPLLFETVWNPDRANNLKQPLAYAALFQGRFSPRRK